MLMQQCAKHYMDIQMQEAEEGRGLERRMTLKDVFLVTFFNKALPKFQEPLKTVSLVEKQAADTQACGGHAIFKL